MIDAVTPEWFLTHRGGIPRQRPKIVMDEFIRCFTPKTVSGCCRDYRAGATINFEMDACTAVGRDLELPASSGKWLNVDLEPSRFIRIIRDLQRRASDG